MALRTRSALRDIVANTTTNSPIKRRKVTEKSKTPKEVAAKAENTDVLPDVTAQYLVSPAPEANLKRKPKLPTRSTTLTSKPLPKLHQSSLPPSSPPSSSSQIPLAFHDQSQYDYPDIRPLSTDPIEGDTVDDDPFGFFAVEQKLKATRGSTAPRPTLPVNADEFSMMSSDSILNEDESSREAFATPRPAVENPLLTPRKRTNARKRKLGLGSESSRSSLDIEDGDEESMPSTPSPVKPGNQSMEVETEKVEEKAEVMEKEKEVRRGRRKVKQDIDAEMNPMEIAQTLEARLPRRPKREVTVIKKTSRGHGNIGKKAPVKDDHDSEADVVKVKKQNIKAKRKAKASVKKTDEEEDEDDQRIRERQTRIDYFKKLDGYEVQTENVYVV